MASFLNEISFSCLNFDYICNTALFQDVLLLIKKINLELAKVYIFLFCYQI